MNDTQLEITPKNRNVIFFRSLFFGLIGITVFLLIKVVFAMVAKSEVATLDFSLLLAAGFLSVIAYILYSFQQSRGQSKLKPAVLKWAKEKYDIDLTEKQAKALSQRSKTPITDIEGYVSESVVIWEKDNLGKAVPRTLRLFLAAGNWILYCTELESEYPLKGEKEEVAFFKTMWTEVRNHEGLFTLRNPQNNSFIGKEIGDNGAALFWSDPLRAELYTDYEGDFEIVFIPVEVFAEDVLLQLESDRRSIGLNWGEEQKSYDASYIRNLMS